jgi:hypothetical protein
VNTTNSNGVKHIITQALTQLGVKHWQGRFIITLFSTLLLLPSRATFCNLSRYSPLNEKTYRRHYRQDFPFERFSLACLNTQLGSTRRYATIIDASYLPKSGKHTYGIDYFYSSCAGKASRGMEISQIAVVDLETEQSYALSCRQTKARQEGEEVPSRPLQYGEHLKETQPFLPEGSEVIIFDSYYAKCSFVDTVCELGLHGVGKLRIDADLRYLYRGAYAGRGRPKRYNGKVDLLDSSRMVYEGEVESEVHVYTSVVWSCALKRVVRIALLVDCRGEKPRKVLLFSTDTLMTGREIVKLYGLRFGVEFLIRDAKQLTGLTDCQARDEEALNFHFNAAFSAVNIAKLHLLQQHEGSEPFVFSLENLKRQLFNEHLLEHIFEQLGLDVTLLKSHPAYPDLISYGAQAA